MIPSGVQVFVALDPVDMRWSFDRLAGAALERIGYDARSGALFIYFGKRRDAVRFVLRRLGNVPIYKRLDRGIFAFPGVRAGRAARRARRESSRCAARRGGSRRGAEVSAAPPTGTLITIS